MLKFQVDAGGHTPEHHFKTRLKKIKHRLIRPLFGNMDIKVSNSSNVKQAGLVLSYNKDKTVVQCLCEYVGCKSITGESISNSWKY